MILPCLIRYSMLNITFIIVSSVLHFHSYRHWHSLFTLFVFMLFSLSLSFYVYSFLLSVLGWLVLFMIVCFFARAFELQLSHYHRCLLSSVQLLMELLSLLFLFKSSVNYYHHCYCYQLWDVCLLLMRITGTRTDTPLLGVQLLRSILYRYIKQLNTYISWFFRQ